MRTWNWTQNLTEQHYGPDAGSKANSSTFYYYFIFTVGETESSGELSQGPRAPEKAELKCESRLTDPTSVLKVCTRCGQQLPTGLGAQGH